MRRHGKRKSHRKQVIFLILSLEVLLILGGLAYIELRPMVVKAVTVEAGEQKLDVIKFLKYKNQQGAFVTDVQKLDTHIPGIYQVQIQVGRRVHTSLLKVVDTIAPNADVTDQFAMQGEEVDPYDFVSNLKDATEVNVYFRHLPDTSVPGDQEVTLLLQDSSGNISEKKAMLTVLELKNLIKIEAGTQKNITINDFVDSSKYEATLITDLSTLNLKQLGSYPVELMVNSKTVAGTIEVVDTIAPKATVKEQTVWKDDAPEAKTFVENITDATKVAVNYDSEPDFKTLGKKEFNIILIDEGGNSIALPVSTEVIEDKEPPVIQGAADKVVFIGDSVSYKKGVTVTDNRDKEVAFSVDNKGVNLKKEGTYTVTYTAKDAAGNKAAKTVNIEVKQFVVTDELINEKCDEILQQVIGKSMTETEVAYEIYKWVRGNIDYSGDSDKSDWRAEAFRGMTNRYGDCFTYFAVSQALLTRAGIDNMEVKRVGGRTKHFWNLVNCGDGWYHYDACPNKDHKATFMLTDQQVKDLTRLRGNNYYTYDKSLYTAIQVE